MPNTSRAPAILFVLSAIAVGLSFLTLLLVSGMLKRYPGSGDFDKQIEAYLRANPQVVLESVEAFQRDQQVAAANELKTVVRERREEIFNDPLSPVLGNPAGDVTIVEFFDYMPLLQKGTACARGSPTGGQRTKDRNEGIPDPRPWIRVRGASGVSFAEARKVPRVPRSPDGSLCRRR